MPRRTFLFALIAVMLYIAVILFLFTVSVPLNPCAGLGADEVRVCR